MPRLIKLVNERRKLGGNLSVKVKMKKTRGGFDLTPTIFFQSRTMPVNNAPKRYNTVVGITQRTTDLKKFEKYLKTKGLELNSKQKIVRQNGNSINRNEARSIQRQVNKWLVEYNPPSEKKQQ